MFYIGTSNITLPVASKSSFPDAFKNASRLTYYASLLNSLEVNSSFYKIPLAKTVSRWATEVPENFRFTFKMNRYITHNKMLIIDESLIARFMQIINHASTKKGALLIQFPASIQYNLRFLQQLLSVTEHYNGGWNKCVEFRHPSWYRDDIYRLLESQHAALVIHDMPNSVTPVTDIWTSFVYLRFHGPTGAYRGSYDLEILERSAEEIRAWSRKGISVYTYFNNTIGSAVFDALTLQELVTGRITYHLG